METFQVNVTYSVNGDISPNITKWSSDGYVGRLVDTQYMDGCDETDWCVFVGTKEECQKYISEHFQSEQKNNK